MVNYKIDTFVPITRVKSYWSWVLPSLELLSVVSTCIIFLYLLFREKCIEYIEYMNRYRCINKQSLTKQTQEKWKRNAQKYLKFAFLTFFLLCFENQAFKIQILTCSLYYMYIFCCMYIRFIFLLTPNLLKIFYHACN